MSHFNDVGRVLDSEDLENQRLVEKPQAYIAELPHISPRVAQGRRGALGAIVTIAEDFAWLLFRLLFITTPSSAIIAFAVAHTALEVVALIAAPTAIISVAAVPFTLGWAAIGRGHRQSNVAMLCIMLAAAALTAFWTAFSLAHIDPAALWEPQ